MAVIWSIIVQGSSKMIHLPTHKNPNMTKWTGFFSATPLLFLISLLSANLSIPIRVIALVFYCHVCQMYPSISEYKKCTRIVECWVRLGTSKVYQSWHHLWNNSTSALTRPLVERARAANCLTNRKEEKSIDKSKLNKSFFIYIYKYLSVVIFEWLFCLIWEHTPKFA